MDRITLGIIVAGLFVVMVDVPLNAQQRQKRPVTYTYTYRTASVVRTQWSPGTPATTVTAATQSPAEPSGSAATTSSDNQAGGPGTAPAAGSPPIQAMPIATNGSQPDQGQNDERLRPTWQQMQNPSGGFHLSHSSFTQNAYFSPNNFLGSQYNNWNNLQPQQFDGFNRTQPDLYFNPLSYTGAANNQWSNLSSGSLSPNEAGGWTYWP